MPVIERITHVQRLVHYTKGRCMKSQRQGHRRTPHRVSFNCQTHWYVKRQSIESDLRTQERPSTRKNDTHGNYPTRTREMWVTKGPLCQLTRPVVIIRHLRYVDKLVSHIAPILSTRTIVSFFVYLALADRLACMVFNCQRNFFCVVIIVHSFFPLVTLNELALDARYSWGILK